ncbi:MAG: UDP-glucose 4-epimerase GalE, partial [Armatimonadota bacterium]
ACVGSPMVEADVEDPGALRSLFQRHAFRAVIHFAARINVGESMTAPLPYYRTNLFGSANLIEAAVEAGVRSFVFSSTAAVYGTPKRTPIRETAPVRPINVYGETKLSVERLLQSVSRSHGLRAACLRYFNAAGADPDGELGEDHRPETHLIPLAIDAALGRREPLTVFGDDYDTPDGTCIRDYVHVSDLCDAHLLALQALDAAEPGYFRAYNVGTGIGHSVREVLDTVSEVAGVPVPHTVGARRPGDPPVLVASNDRIRSELGWQPRHADLRAMVAHALAWRKGHPDGYGEA